MEKKNTILLTVIAIATLLVAVVGATFAYFTAQVTTTGKEGNETVNVKTYALTEVTMERGSKVESKGMYPGSVLAKDFTITANCPTGNTTCEDIYTTLTITVNNPTTEVDVIGEDGNPTGDKETVKVFGDHISWKLYQMNTKGAKMTCNEGTTKNAGGMYYVDGASCDTTGATLVKSGTATDTYDITAVGYGDNKTDYTYYLVVEYVNETDKAQNGEQGQEFSVTLSYATKTEQTTTTTPTTPEETEQP